MPRFALADVHDDLKAYLASVENGGIRDKSAIRAAPPDQLLAALQPYAKHEKFTFRQQALYMASNIAHNSPDPKIRQQAIRFVFEFFATDKNLGLRANAAQQLASQSLNLTRADFTDEMRKTIVEIVKQPKPYDHFLLLAGVADAQEAKERIRELATIPKNTAGVVTRFDTSWQAHLALARLGDRRTIQLIVDMVEATADEGARYRSLVEDLAYVRQRQSIDRLIEYLFSEKTSPIWHEFGAQMGGEKYAFYTLRPLWWSIEGFPVLAKHLELLSYEDIEKARKWITANRTNLKIRR